jgi:hypothetical protein
MEFASLLFSALSADYGIKVTTSDPELLRQKLYKERRGDSTFLPLSFVISPENPKGELWIVKREARDEQE